MLDAVTALDPVVTLDFGHSQDLISMQRPFHAPRV